MIAAFTYFFVSRWGKDNHSSIGIMYTLGPGVGKTNQIDTSSTFHRVVTKNRSGLLGKNNNQWRQIK